MPAVGKSPFGSVFRGPPSDDRCSGPMQAEAGNIWHRSEKPATGFWRGRSGLSRRQWLLGMLEVGGWTALQGAGPPSAAFADETTPQPELFPRPAPGVEIWDAHVHLDGGTGTPSDRARFLLKYADRMGIRRLILCMGPKFQPDPTPDQLREQNDAVLEAIRVAPDRFLGFVYLNPKHREASLQEIERCVVRGPMVGIKLWVAMRCQEPALDPLMRRAAELRLPVLQHTFFRLGGNLPGESSPDDLVQLAARHPQVNFICAHTGADWERGIRAVRAQKKYLGRYMWIGSNGRFCGNGRPGTRLPARHLWQRCFRSKFGLPIGQSAFGRFASGSTKGDFPRQYRPTDGTGAGLAAPAAPAAFLEALPKWVARRRARTVSNTFRFSNSPFD